MATIADISNPKFKVGFVKTVPKMSFGKYQGKVSTDYTNPSEEFHIYTTSSNVIALEAFNTTLKNMPTSELMRENPPSVCKLYKIVQPCPYTDLFRERATPDQLYRAYNTDTQTFDWDRVDCVAEEKARAIIEDKLAKEEDVINQQWYALAEEIYNAVREKALTLRDANKHKTLRPCITIIKIPDGIQYGFRCSSISHVDANNRESNLSGDVNGIRLDVRWFQKENNSMHSWFICE